MNLKYNSFKLPNLKEEEEEVTIYKVKIEGEDKEKVYRAFALYESRSSGGLVRVQNMHSEWLVNSIIKEVERRTEDKKYVEILKVIKEDRKRLREIVEEVLEIKELDYMFDELERKEKEEVKKESKKEEE